MGKYEKDITREKLILARRSGKNKKQQWFSGD